jgi:hypothetical protein
MTVCQLHNAKRDSNIKCLQNLLQPSKLRNTSTVSELLERDFCCGWRDFSGAGLSLRLVSPAYIHVQYRQALSWA